MDTENNDPKDAPKAADDFEDIFADNGDNEANENAAPKELSLESIPEDNSEENNLADPFAEPEESPDSKVETPELETTEPSVPETAEPPATETISIQESTQPISAPTDSQDNQAAFTIISFTKIPNKPDISFKTYWERRAAEITENLEFAIKSIATSEDDKKEYFTNLKNLYQNVTMDIDSSSETVQIKKQDTIIASIINTEDRTIIEIAKTADTSLQEQAILLTTHELNTHKQLSNSESKLEISASEDSDPLTATRIYQKTLLEGHDPDIAKKTLKYWKEQADKLKDEI